MTNLYLTEITYRVYRVVCVQKYVVDIKSFRNIYIMDSLDILNKTK